MNLIFDIIKTNIGSGSCPDLIHFENTQAQRFSISGGNLYGNPSDKIDLGDWSKVNFQQEDILITPDNNMSNFEVKKLQGFGVIGGYKHNNIHKMIIYEFAFEMDRYLESGTINLSLENPINSLNLNLKNPASQNPEHPGNEALSELSTQTNLLAPGARIKVYFGAGDEIPHYELGTFYIDRSRFELLNNLATVDTRNSIGKVLKDQSLDEKNEFWYQTIDKSLIKLLSDAGLEKDKYIVEPTSKSGWFTFPPNTKLFSAIESMLESLPQWKIAERSDGIIVIGSSNFYAFDTPGIYTFQRNKDIFSREIVREDDKAYNRVCVHTANFDKTAYRSVASFKTWNLQANKTLYVQIADGLKYSDLTNYANELANRLEKVGKIESFNGPIRPHLQPGDEAIILDQNGIQESLGIITEVSHSIGSRGYYTDFTVDSGGTVGKGRISDYINKIMSNSDSAGPNTGWDDIDEEEYINVALMAEFITSSTKRPSFPARLLNDNLMYAPNDLGWSPSADDIQPTIDVIFGRRCMINSIQLWFGYDNVDTDPIYLPDYYRIEYYNNGEWTEFITITSASTPIEIKMTHHFSAIETSKIRFVLGQKSDQLWREIQVLGFI